MESPVSEPEAARQGKNQRSCVRCTVQYFQETEGRDRGERHEKDTEGRDEGKRQTD